MSRACFQPLGSLTQGACCLYAAHAAESCGGSPTGLIRGPSVVAPSMWADHPELGTSASEPRRVGDLP